MASERQIAANRRNAQRSTGPRTTEGKARSRHNALKHGLASKMPTDGLPAGEALGASVHDPIPALAQVIAGEAMADPQVLACAEQIAAETLTIRRIHTLKAAVLAGRDKPADPGSLPLRATPTPGDTGASLPLLLQLHRLERYERRALARRSKALREWERVR